MIKCGNKDCSEHVNQIKNNCKHMAPAEECSEYKPLIEKEAPVSVPLSVGLSAFTDTEKEIIDNLDARFRRRGFSFLATDYITLQAIIPKLKALLDESR